MPTPLATRLEDALKAADLDQEEVARVVGANPRTVSRWLKQEAAPRREARERLLASFEVVNAHFQRLFTSLFGGAS
jgi:chromosome segregation protein